MSRDDRPATTPPPVRGPLASRSTSPAAPSAERHDVTIAQQDAPPTTPASRLALTAGTSTRKAAIVSHSGDTANRTRAGSSRSDTRTTLTRHPWPYSARTESLAQRLAVSQHGVHGYAR